MKTLEQLKTENERLNDSNKGLDSKILDLGNSITKLHNNLMELEIQIKTIVNKQNIEISNVQLKIDEANNHNTRIKDEICSVNRLASDIESNKNHFKAEFERESFELKSKIDKVQRDIEKNKEKTIQTTES